MNFVGWRGFQFSFSSWSNALKNFPCNNPLYLRNVTQCVPKMMYLIFCEHKQLVVGDNTDTVFTSILDVSLYNPGPYFKKERSVTEGFCVS